MLKVLREHARFRLNRLAWRAAGALTGANFTPASADDSSLEKPLFVWNQNDRTAYLDQTQISPETIQAARTAAVYGNLFQVARINDLMISTDPFIKGARLQRKSGVSSVKWGIKAANDTPEAEEIADAVREACDAPDASFVQLIHAIVEGILRGVGLIEVIWSPAGDETFGKYRRWIGFEPIPQARLRWNLDGEFAFADTITAFQGMPVSGMPRGKFIPITTETDVPAYGLRGYYPAIWSPWLDRVYGRKWRRTSTERFGAPIPIAKFGNEAQATKMKEALENWGANGSFIIPKESEFDLKYGPTSGQNDPQRLFMLDAADEISVCFVGQQQTMQIRAGAGSKASAGVQNLVRLDILIADWAIIMHLVRMHLFASFVEQNFGPEKISLTPKLVPDLEEAIDVLKVAQASQILVNLGLEIPKSYFYDMGFREPDSDDEILYGTAPKDPNAPPPQAFGLPGGPPQLGPDGKPIAPPPEKPPLDSNVVSMTDKLAGAAARRAQLMEADLVDVIAGKYLAAGANAAKPFLAAIKGIVEETERQGGNIELVKQRVLAAYGKLPLSQLTDVLASAMFEAEFRGMLTAQEEADALKPQA